MAKNKKKNSRIKFSALIYLIAPIIILAFLIFNDKGILKYLKIKDKVKSLEEKIDSSENRIKQLEAEIDSLKNDQFKIEKTAREKYNMKRPLEKGLDVKVKKNVN